MADLDAILRFLGPGATPALVLFIAGLYARKFVLGWQFDELAKDRDEWKAIALHGLTSAEKSVETTAKVVAKAVDS